MSIKSVMPSSHLILCHPLLLLPPIPPSIKVFSNESTLCMRWPKYWSFSFSISPSKEIPGLISLRMDWLDLLAYQHFILFLWLNIPLNIPLLYATISLSIHPSVDTGCFHILAIVKKKNAAVNMEGCVCPFESVFSFSSDKYPWVDLLDLMLGFYF